MDRNLDAKLLIGANSLRALEPKEVISSQGDRPFMLSRQNWDGV